MRKNVLIPVLFFSAFLINNSLGQMLPLEKIIPKSYYQVASTELKEIPGPTFAPTFLSPFILTKGCPLIKPTAVNETFDPEIIGDLIKVGKSIWDIVLQGQPVCQTEFGVIHLLPYIDNRQVELLEMDSWSQLRTKSYLYTVTNALHMETVQYRFAVTYRPGGSYQGKGSYLSGVDIIPLSVSVKWGYTFNAKAKVKEFLNKGNRENPIAHISLDHTFSSDTVLSHNAKTQVFEISGDGTLLGLDL